MGSSAVFNIAFVALFDSGCDAFRDRLGIYGTRKLVVKHLTVEQLRRLHKLDELFNEAIYNSPPYNTNGLMSLCKEVVERCSTALERTKARDIEEARKQLEAMFTK